jgi:hypothetical protein
MFAPSLQSGRAHQSTDAPFLRRLGAFFSALFFAAAHALAATELYVSPSGSDTSSCSQSAPCRQISRAASLAGPDTTVHVAPGTYAGGFTTTASGTASARIKYVSDIKWGARISDSSESWVLWWNQGSYVDITGFEIDGSGSLPVLRQGFYCDGSHVTFVNNKVHDILTTQAAYLAATSSGKGGAGIGMDNYNRAVDQSTIGNIVYNIGPNGRFAPPGAHGIYHNTPGIVMNNVIYDINGIGISTWHGAENVSIINNTVDNARRGGILVGSGDSGVGSGTGDGFTVANNIVTSSYGGISEGGQTGSNNYYINNLFYQNYARPNYSIKTGHTPVGTINADPKFVANSDYHLQSGSPAIDAGVSTVNGISAPSTDNDGNGRPVGNGYDIGAYEYGGR